VAITIGIYGIDGMYNYGCEAIIRGTVEILRSLTPGCRIIYYSHRADADKVQVADCELEIKQIAYKAALVERIINMILRWFDIKYRIPFKDYNLICDESNVVFSIGGDIYTIPTHIRERKKYKYYNELVQFGEKVKRRNKILVIFGASVGPFGDYAKAKKYYFNHFYKVDMIVCRERNTLDYLETNGMSSNLFFYPDPAFFVVDKQNIVLENEMRFIGINLSALSLVEMYGDVTIVQKQELAKLISKIAKNFKKNILLIPHVISPVNPMDNDLSFLAEIYNLVDDDIKESVTLLNQAGGFVQTKKYLRNCDVVVAARMHCAINAICEAVPTILLSYSEKSKGIAKFVYNNENWVLPLNKVETDLIDKITEILAQRAELKCFLKEKIEVIRNSRAYDGTLQSLMKMV
jgi:polysaccharide pyruvyl transferase WcaK-like protein